MGFSVSSPDRPAGSGFFHPATPLAAWLMLAVMLPLWPWPLQLAAAAACAGLAARRERAAPWLAARRVRWLLAALLAAMAWSTPGQALWPADWAPTREGVQEGGLHALRLLALLWCMKALFASRSRQAWLLGLRTLCWPLTWLGLDINRAALRLWLTLEESERLTGQAPPRWRDLWQALSAAPTAASAHAQGDEGRALTLQLQALTARDLLAWLVLALALAASVFG